MADDLLIHSMKEFESITIPLLEAVNAKTICEIGAEHGGNSQLLYEWLAPRNGLLYSIDPAPSAKFLNWLTGAQEVVKHIPSLSLQAIPELSSIDAWFIDGDHNWYTVYHELSAIRTLNLQQKIPTLIFLHDVCWPSQQRDTYYLPETIPAAYQHPSSFELGVTYGQEQLIAGGFRSHGHYAVALHEGGERNGVLTAVNDFMAEYKDEYCLAVIPAVFGLGILYNCTHPKAQAIAKMILPYHQNQLLQKLERNRLANYLKVIEYQDEQAKIAAKHAADIATLQAKINYLQDTVAKKLVIELIESLEDENDHPEIWASLRVEPPQHLQEILPFMLDYIQQLLAIPQDKKVFKLISVLYAVCQAHAGKCDSAKELLYDLNTHHAPCPAVIGALSFVEQIKNLSRNVTTTA